ncbi:serine/threonine-protein kinase [Georgenia subflava]|uniref:non-specific serine/threonine protein kinase n=1 Tax=Georgenia subflava TaxID=1622177 RepID=A0A6N7EK65_9MICO|nr:serine/threonine-protein kinase [Georgenia subflava]MPV37187.1 protein kinase [Georgenia subflava]
MSRRPAAQHPELAGYTYEKLLGSGGFADVYLYTQQMPHRKVAVKVLTREATEGQPREQFVAEANLMARLSGHSSIVAIYHAAQAPDGRPYLVMQYCPLPNLAERLKVRPLGVAEAVGIGIRLAGAVETAHRAGIVHRDIKPANVLTTEYGRPALTDFGIAGLTSTTVEETAGVSIPWAPPESVEGHPAVGVTGDVYSLAATIYTLLAGRSPFTRPGGPNTRLDYTRRIRRDPVPPIGRGDVPPSLERVLARGMAKTPSHRYGSALDLGRALQVIEQELRLPMTDIEVPDTSWMGGAPAPADGASGGDGGDNRTVVRQVVEVDPHRAGSPAEQEDRTVVRGATTVAGAQRQASAGWEEASLGATELRGGEVAEDVEESAGPRRRGPLVAAAVGVLVVVVGLVLGAGALRGETPPEPTAEPGAGIPIPEQVPAPADLSGTRSEGTVTFTWAPPEDLAGEDGLSYTWQRTDPGADTQVHPSDEPTAVVEADGQVCVAVKARLENGRTSTQPAETCVE